ncbi:segregation and condensation protein A [Muricoccus radiodurans]|uniref:segregation and condensation protein A n=1 Tax=Muricoccus radiodurans TaxID=2231721 RepID=UPI003CF41391
MAEADGDGDEQAAEEEGWEVARNGTPPGREALHLDLRGYAGPLDLLLDLVRAGRVDIGAISILDLAGQFQTAVERAIARRDVPLSRLGGWLVAAANLALLRSRLLLPADSREGQEARQEADALRRQLADRAAVAALSDWLTRRPTLGREVFARGASDEAHGAGEGRGVPPVADLTTLLRVCLELMRRPERVPAYQPTPPDIWRPPAALDRIRRMLGELDAAGEAGALPLEIFLPPWEAMRSPLQRRAAIASTLVAGLELARDAVTHLEQNAPFDTITVQRTGSALPSVA